MDCSSCCLSTCHYSMRLMLVLSQASSEKREPGDRKGRHYISPTNERCQFARRLKGSLQRTGDPSQGLLGLVQPGLAYVHGQIP